MIPHRWRRAPADNQSADPNADLRKNRSANTVLGAIRGLMATAAASRDDNTGLLVASLGANNAYSVSTNEGLVDPATQVNGLTPAITTPFLLRLGFDTALTGVAANAPTLKVDQAVAVPILRRDGSALVDGDLVTGRTYLALGDMAVGTDTTVTRVRILEALPSDTAAAIAAAQASVGFRNRLINGAFRLNQRLVQGTVNLAAGAYGHDRWKAGANGCRYTFQASASGDVQITILLGSLTQVIEGPEYLPDGGNFVLNWDGTATGRVFPSGAAPGALAAAPVKASGFVAGTNAVVEFGPGTLGRVQFEAGAAPTSFERRDLELQRARRYYQRITLPELVDNGASAGRGCRWPLSMTPMRSGQPAASLTPNGGSNVNGQGVAYGSFDTITITATALADGQVQFSAGMVLTLEAEL